MEGTGRSETAETLGWQELRVESYCQLISEYELVPYNSNEQLVRVDKGLKKLILQLDRMPTSAP
jgi:hypothetical protein